ncbi:MAG: hypothetical protein V1887_00815, partial [Candidatus Aenigmatarchaeota archaeon]
MSYEDDTEEFLTKTKPLIAAIRRKRTAMENSADKDSRPFYEDRMAKHALMVIDSISDFGATYFPLEKLDVIPNASKLRESNETYRKRLEKLDERQKRMFDIMVACPVYVNPLGHSLHGGIYCPDEEDVKRMKEEGAQFTTFRGWNAVEDYHPMLDITYTPIFKYQDFVARLWHLKRYMDTVNKRCWTHAEKKCAKIMINAANRLSDATMTLADELVGFVLDQQGKEHEKVEMGHDHDFYVSENGQRERRWHVAPDKRWLKVKRGKNRFFSYDVEKTLFSSG